MKYTIEKKQSVIVLNILEPRMIYEALDPIQEKFTDLVSQGERKIVIDFEQVEYLDSFAVGFIMDMFRRVTNEGGQLMLSGLAPRVKKILQITRVDNVIGIHDSVDEAVDALAAVEG